jgi:hypothetical protein
MLFDQLVQDFIRHPPFVAGFKQVLLAQVEAVTAIEITYWTNWFDHRMVTYCRLAAPHFRFDKLWRRVTDFYIW